MPSAVVICPVLPWPPIGGAEKRTLRLLEAMDGAGATPHLISHSAPREDAVERLRERGWAVEVVPALAPGLGERARQHLARRPSPYVPAVEARLQALAATGPAFVQVEHAMAAYYLDHHPARRWILSMHNVDSQVHATVAGAAPPFSAARLRSRMRSLSTAAVERRAAPAADAVLCVSEDDRDHFARLGANALLVPNGVDEELFEVPAGLPAGERVLFFGRLDYAPNALGLERFLREGWPRLASARPAATLRVAGGGLSAGLARLIDGAPRVEALGVVEDLPAEIAESRVVVLPVWQGGGTRLKALEAMAAARPVAGPALAMSGIGFRDGVHGLLAEQPAEIAAAVAGLLADPARSASLAAAARSLAEGFRWRRVLQPAAELYARLAATD